MIRSYLKTGLRNLNGNKLYSQYLSACMIIGMAITASCSDEDSRIQRIIINGPDVIVISHNPSEEFIAKAYNTDNRIVRNAKITWSTSDPDVATIDEQGKVTPITVGEIYVYASVNQITSEKLVQIINFEPIGISIATSRNFASSDNGEVSFTARVVDKFGNTEARPVVWQVSDDQLATISNEGILTTKAHGTVNVIATFGSLSAQRQFSIYPVKGTGAVHVDDAIYSFMKRWNLPGASICFSRNEKLIYQRGIGYADRNLQQPVKTDDIFRIASVTKPITSIAIFHLIEQGKLALTSKVFGENGVLNDFDDIADTRIYSITVNDLLLHQAGWDLLQSGDPIFKPFTISSEMGVPSPPDEETIVRYVLKNPLDFSPTSRVQYSNFGYMLLGLIIEEITGMPYDTFVKQNILASCGITGMSLAGNLLTERQAHEVLYYSQPGEPLQSSVFGTGETVTGAYGGMNVGVMDAFGGWLASSTDLLRFLTRVDKFDMRPDILSSTSLNLMTSTSTTAPNIFSRGWASTQGNYWHYGSFWGSSAGLYRRNDGISWSCIFNSWPTQASFFTEFDQLMNDVALQIHLLPDQDLF